MRFAAIDIGSNAVRLLVEDLSFESGVVQTEKIAFTRMPIRLGEDVFESGQISKGKADQLVLVLQAFSRLMESLDVRQFQVCATSAMREATNRDLIVDRVGQEAGLRVEVIDGRQEAELIFRNFSVSMLDPRRDYLYIDVGGGSTELTWIREAQPTLSKSFKIGAVRMLRGKVKPKVWDSIGAFLAKRPSVSASDTDTLTAIGTGGNINRMARLSGYNRHTPIPLEKLIDVHATVERHSIEERMTLLGMKPDRADVIIPAGEIYLRIMEAAGAQEIIVPKVGLADGMILEMFRASL
jgi:exopolyphosphatase/guanosine-5'-triphosphate,3'-diphosphate pyrophosphatase